jgi:hypothetical protein
MSLVIAVLARLGSGVGERAMCYMVTLGLKKRNRAIVVQGLERAGLLVHPEPGTVPFAGADETMMVSYGGCGCSLVANDADPATPEEVAARFKKKGWSDQKVKRAVESVLSKPRTGSTEQVKAFAEAVVAGCANRNEVWVLVEWWNSERPEKRPASGTALKPEEFLELQGNYPVGEVLRVSRSAR